MLEMLIRQIRDGFILPHRIDRSGCVPRTRPDDIAVCLALDIQLRPNTDPGRHFPPEIAMESSRRFHHHGWRWIEFCAEGPPRLSAVAIDDGQAVSGNGIVHVRMLAMPAPDRFQVSRRILDTMWHQRTDRMLAGACTLDRKHTRLNSSTQCS